MHFNLSFQIAFLIYRFLHLIDHSKLVSWFCNFGILPINSNCFSVLSPHKLLKLNRFYFSSISNQILSVNGHRTFCPLAYVLQPVFYTSALLARNRWQFAEFFCIYSLGQAIILSAFLVPELNQKLAKKEKNFGEKRRTITQTDFAAVCDGAWRGSGFLQKTDVYAWTTTLKELSASVV